MERLTLVTGMLLVTVGEAGGTGVVLAVWVTTDAKLATEADVVVPVTDGSVAERPDSVVCSINPDVYSVVDAVVCVVATGILVVVVVVSVEAVVSFSVGVVVRCVVSVFSVVVGGEVLVVTTSAGVSSCVVATDPHEVTTGVTRVETSGVELEVLVVSRETADVGVIEAVDGTATATVSRETLVVTGCVVTGLVVDV